MWLGNFKIEYMYTLSLPHREDRRAALQLQIRTHKNLKHAYVYGDTPSAVGSCQTPPECCLMGWVKMVRAAVAFPALFTEDDIDLHMHFDPLLIPNSSGILSIAAGNCRVKNCSRPRWMLPRRRPPYTYGTIAIVITDSVAASEFVSHVLSKRTRRWSHIDGKLYLGNISTVSILCPPLFSWTSSFSDILHSVRRFSVECHTPNNTRTSNL